MRLTRKIAIEKCKELWKWCAETGKAKRLWPKWGGNEKYAKPQGSSIMCHCWFCEYAHQRRHANKKPKQMCQYCPYYKKYGHCVGIDAPYFAWNIAMTVAERKKYAKLFYNQIKTLK